MLRNSSKKQTILLAALMCLLCIASFIYLNNSVASQFEQKQESKHKKLSTHLPVQTEISNVSLENYSQFLTEQNQSNDDEQLPSELTTQDAQLLTTDKKKQSLEFIDINSEEYEEILTEYLETSTIVIRENIGYLSYKSELGVEFFKVELDDLVNSKEHFYELYQTFEKELEESEADWSLENELTVINLIDEFNPSEFYLSTLQCKTDMCVAQILIPNQNINVMAEFYDYIKARRITCSCKALGHYSELDSEGIFKFFFD